MNFILTPCICVSHVTVTVTWFDLFVLDMNTETACEGKTLDLRCKKGMTIDIESAIYGRLRIHGVKIKFIFTFSSFF
jgi:hypothetical protein